MALAIKMVDLSWIIPLGKSQVSHDTYELDPCPVTQSGTIGHTVAKSCKKSSKLFLPGFLADIFKLADRMRSIRTTGASKNRDCSRFSRFS